MWELELRQFGKEDILGSLEIYKFNHITLDHLSTEFSHLLREPVPLWIPLDMTGTVMFPLDLGSGVGRKSQDWDFTMLSPLTKGEVQGNNRSTRPKSTLNLNFMKELQSTQTVNWNVPGKLGHQLPMGRNHLVKNLHWVWGPRFPKLLVAAKVEMELVFKAKSLSRRKIVKMFFLRKLWTNGVT